MKVLKKLTLVTLATLSVFGTVTPVGWTDFIS